MAAVEFQGAPPSAGLLLFGTITSMSCNLCDLPCAPRLDRPGKYYTLCPAHLAEYKRLKNRESYERHQAQRVQDKRDARAERPEEILQQKRESDARVKADPVRRAARNAYMTAYVRQWQRDNRDKRRAIEKRWVDANRERVREKNRARYALRRGAPGKTSFEQTRARWDFYGGLCWMCGLPADTIDHVKPIAKGGSEWPANLRPACRSCNSAKADEWPLLGLDLHHAFQG